MARATGRALLRRLLSPLATAPSILAGPTPGTLIVGTGTFRKTAALLRLGLQGIAERFGKG
ncbi:hypothetical protein [Micromonospora sp. CB01531]|uniref:hypothetical protein n=1 Tax=Micromonospora sp. CB01531 TaxID=1718947 RepID=UPI000B07DAE1|nr:hypothetical protein [Micromonospora sp. CB01531]